MICDSSCLGGWIMSAPLPAALRTRFKRLIEEGLSGRAAALRLKVSPATGARWAHQVRTKGHAEPAPQGPPRGKGKLAPHQAFLEELVAQDPDITSSSCAMRWPMPRACGCIIPPSPTGCPSSGSRTKKVAGRHRAPAGQGKAAARGLVQTSAACHCGLARTRCLH